MLITIITKIIEAIIIATGKSREAIAAELQEITDDLKAGGIVPDELFDKVSEDHARIAATRASLPSKND